VISVFDFEQFVCFTTPYFVKGNDTSILIWCALYKKRVYIIRFQW